jgi:subtilase family serine protease
LSQQARRLLFAAIFFVAALVATSASAAPSPRAALAGSVPSWASSANFKNATPSTDWVNFRVYLNLRNESQAEALARAVSDPSSASYGKYLSPAQFNQQFAPTKADVSAVTQWLQGQGLAVDYVPSNNHYVAAEGTAAQVSAAFGVQLNQYNVNGKVLRAPGSDLSVPSSLSSMVAGVLGVDQSAALIQPDIATEPNAGPSAGFRNARPCSSYWGQYTTANTPVSDPVAGFSNVYLPDYLGSPRPFAPCGYAGAQLQSPYGVSGASNSGAGVTVAIIDAYASPTITSDANTYFSRHGLPTFTSGQFSQVVAPGIYNHPENRAQDPQGWYGEETLDVEAVHTTAPGAKIVYVGSPNNYRDLDAAMNYVVSRHAADIVTNSYGFSTELLPPGYVKPVNDTFIQGAIEGIGIYFSSGDSGDETFGGPASTATVDWPASSPWVTAVGGTSLAVGQSNDYLFETGWGTKRNRLNCKGFLKQVNSWCATEPYLYGSGGGTSRIFAEPSYQQGVVPDSLATRWSTSFPGRVVPDISAVGDPNTGMLIGQTQAFSNGNYYDEFRIGGTSLSSPLMAGIMAVAQQTRGSDIGFANPLIYSLPAGAFHDVVSPASTVADVRADFANNEDGSAGILYSIRRMNWTWTLSTTPGYDDVTGRGSPNGSFVSAVASAK